MHLINLSQEAPPLHDGRKQKGTGPNTSLPSVKPGGTGTLIQWLGTFSSRTACRSGCVSSRTKGLIWTPWKVWFWMNINHLKFMLSSMYSWIFELLTVLLSIVTSLQGFSMQDLYNPPFLGLRALQVASHTGLQKWRTWNWEPWPTL